MGHIDTGQQGVRFKGFNDLHRHHVTIKVARDKLFVWFIPLSKMGCCCISKCFNSTPFQNQFYMALFDGVVSQLLVELPRTVKDQNGVEFDFQSIKNTIALLAAKYIAF